MKYPEQDAVARAIFIADTADASIVSWNCCQSRDRYERFARAAINAYRTAQCDEGTRAGGFWGFIGSIGR